MAFDPKEILKKIQQRRATYKKRQAQEVCNLNGDTFMVMAREYQAAHNCRLIDALMAISRKHPEAHEQYIRQANS